MFFGKKKKKPSRRRHPRIKSLNLMRWSYTDPTYKGQSWTGNIRDLSESGSRFYTDHEVIPGVGIEMTLNFSRTDREVTLIGKVAWAKKVSSHGNVFWSVGVSFVEMKEEDRGMIRTMVEKMFKNAA